MSLVYILTRCDIYDPTHSAGFDWPDHVWIGKPSVDQVGNRIEHYEDERPDEGVLTEMVRNPGPHSAAEIGSHWWYLDEWNASVGKNQGDV